MDRVRDLSEVNSRITTGAVVFKFMKLISDNKLFTGGKEGTLSKHFCAFQKKRARNELVRKTCNGT